MTAVTLVMVSIVHRGVVQAIGRRGGVLRQQTRMRIRCPDNTGAEQGKDQ